MKTKISKQIRFISIALFLLLFTNGVYAQSLKKTFKYIKEDELVKADVEIQEANAKGTGSNEDYTLYSLAKCLVFCNENYQNYDPYKSIELFNAISAVKADNSKVNDFLGNYELSIYKVQQIIFQSIFSQAQKINTEASYDKALSVCQYCFNQTQKNNTTESFKKASNDCQFCFYHEDAIKLKEEAAYNEAKKTNTLNAYEKFIKAYPNTIHKDEIIKTIEELAYVFAKYDGTAEAMSNYIKKYSRKGNINIEKAIILRDSLAKKEAGEQELKRIAKIKMKKELLKTEILQSSSDNTNFPLKYYNGNQFYYDAAEDGYPILYGIDDNCAIRKLNFDNPELRYVGRNYQYKSNNSLIALGESNKNESFRFSSINILPDISSKNIQEIGLGWSSYNNKTFLITKTFETFLGQTSSGFNFISASMIGFDKIFQENPDIDKVDNLKYCYSARLSNNDILIIYKANIEYLSNQLNRMFGIDGANNISRTFASSSYYKFFVISSDGSVLKSTMNYILPSGYDSNILAVDGGFILVSENLGSVISLSESDFGRKSSVYSKEAGKYITVTESVNFGNNSSPESEVEGIKLFKFNNSAQLVNQLVIDNPKDQNIYKPRIKKYGSSENYFCLMFTSYEQEIVNIGQNVFKLFDFDLNLKSTYIDKTNFSSCLNIRAKDDIFYAKIKNYRDDDNYKAVPVPFKIE